jgi:hypothetical protein
VCGPVLKVLHRMRARRHWCRERSNLLLTLGAAVEALFASPALALPWEVDEGSVK